MKKLLFAALLWFCTTQMVVAQTCEPTHTVRQCFVSVRTQKTARSQTEQKPTGDAQATGTATSIHDFLPKIAAAATMPGLTEGIAGLSLARNFSLDNEYTGYLPFALQLSAKLHKPVVFQTMLEKLPELKQSSFKSRVEKTFDEFDDPELSFAVAVESRKLGRRFERHRQELSNVVSPEPAPILLLVNELQLLVLTAPASCGQGDNLDRLLNCWPETDRAKIIDAIRKLIDAETATSKAIDAWQATSGWDRIPDLINNKPQLTFRGGWRPRDPAVGTETWQGTARYEMGLANINATRRFCQKNGGYIGDKFTADCFKQHVTSEQNQTLLELGIRLFVQFEYKRDKKYNAPFLPADSVILSLPETNSWSLTGGIGGNLPSNAKVQSARMDLGFEYTGADRDGARTDERTSISLTHTQKLADKLSLLAGIEWSDKGEFKAEPTAKLRARLGVRYKLITDEPGK